VTNDAPATPEPGTTPISDEFMTEMMSKSRTYTLMVLKATPALRRPDADPIIWEHGRRNFALRAEGLLAIVCPAPDDSELAGIGLFNVSEAELERIMDEDPGVKAGIFTYEVHPVRSFPGDRLPGEPSLPR
jgi:hypothetical protein